MSTGPGGRVVYLALGVFRVRAALAYCAELVARGCRVHLVVADAPEWSEAGRTGATVHRLGPHRLRQAARLLLAGPGGLLRRADLLIAGDLPALPVAWAAARRHPRVTVRFEPADEPRRRTAPADLAVITPWYPSPNNAMAGAFVQATTAAVRERFDRVALLHTEDWSYPPDWRSGALVRVARRRMARRSTPVVVTDTAEGELTRVAVPLLSGNDYAGWAGEHVETLRASLPTGRIEAPLIHAHTGIYGGLAALRLARPDARVIVTEHATFLPKVLGQPEARRLYDEMLGRADALVCVSRHLYDQVRERFPHHVGKLHVIPNVIDFDRFTARPEPPADLLRWLYVGRLIKHKGVSVVLDAFAEIAAEEPRATFTLVGDGPLTDHLRGRARELGLADRVRIRPAVAPEQVVALMHAHDLLVHGSRLETFGMTLVEAVATGMPVLAMRSAGPAESLAGLEGMAGRLVDVSAGAAAFAAGYRSLRAARDQLDLVRARRILQERYGRDTIAAKLTLLYGGQLPPPPLPAEPAPAEGSAGHVLLIAVDPPHYRNVGRYAAALVAQGYRVDLVTPHAQAWLNIGVDPRVRLRELHQAEARLLVNRVEHAVRHAAGRVLDHLSGPARQFDAVWPEVAVNVLQRGTGKVTDALHRRVYNRLYSVVRPQLLWRIVRRDLLPGLDLSRVDRIVVAGRSGITAGWQLARRRPGLTVTTALTAPQEAAA
ncbi:glycosyltransferase [Catellatospora sp. KI3]|uniref:glycosyltransferase n=1 Tax=Catellatospora sp. KI3 TaxID=3041620 RepID=UPI0024830302|nr:glycosyltransferase [Catellatospora sp. KI3]MDI1460065.1 glycosyltransferase [Catellatospora sp. KI3]